METTRRKVNLVATRARLTNSGRMMSSYARAKGLNPETVRMFFNGRIPVSGGPVCAKILEALTEDGLLVEEDEDADTAKAA